MSGSDSGPLSHISYGVGDPTVVMIPPNPCDATYWAGQLARYSTWYRTLAIDVPGYGFSPPAPEGVSLSDVARQIWSTVDTHTSGPVAVVGVSMGSTLALHMRQQRPAQVAGLILSGCSYRPVKDFAFRRRDGYAAGGIEYRHQHLRDGFSPAFLSTSAGQRTLVRAEERDGLVDVDSVVRLFEAHAVPDPEPLFDVAGPVLIISGTADYAHDGAVALAQRLGDARFVPIDGAGHACSVEAEDEFDRLALGFLAEIGVRS